MNFLMPLMIGGPDMAKHGSPVEKFTVKKLMCKRNSSKNPEDLKNKTDIVLKGKVVLDRKAAAEVAEGISSLVAPLTNVGFAATVGALAGSVTKGVAKTSLPPIQKAGVILKIMAGGLVGAVLHVGGSAINAQTHAAARLKQPSNNTENLSNINTTSDLLKNPEIKKFMGSGLEFNTPLEILL